MKIDFTEREKPREGRVEPHRPKISSESEKEKTKLRERKRRSITSRILYGLRKHGNYDLPPRADINDVLKALANEAGWEVEADGTTYRRSQKHQQTSGISPSLSPLRNIYPVVGPLGGNSLPGNFSAIMTSFNSIIPSVVSDPLDLRGGDCSTTASPRRLGSSSLNLLRTNSTFSSPFGSPTSSEAVSNLQVVNTFGLGALSNGLMPVDSYGFKDDLSASLFSNVNALDAQDWLAARTAMGNPSSSNALQSSNLHQAMRIMIPTLPELNPFLQEAKASNQNTPIGSPQPGHGGSH